MANLLRDLSQHPRFAGPPEVSESSRRIVRGVGLALGIALAALAVVGWRVPRGTGTLGADVQFITLATGPLDLTPVGLIASGTDLRPVPGSVASGSVLVRNVTGRAQDVRVRAIASGPDLDPLLEVSLASDSATLYSGPLGGLRTWTVRGVRLASGQAARLRLRAWLPATAAHGYQDRIETITLEWDVRSP